MVKNYNFKKFLQTIGTNLKAERTKKDLSIAAVAKAVKTSSHTLRRIENGAHNMRLELLERLCIFYKVSPGDMAKEKK
jgi:transcriptional regulator with XRE-family HTH domain